jgi:glutamyl-tRNA synthetase
MNVRTRFAPSPTGLQQLGGFRTILFNYLVSRQASGQFLLRIEDTDQARLVGGSVENLLESMRWLGLEPDEGVCLDGNGNITEKGEYGPYTQSLRLSIYHAHIQTLLESGHAYRCFCAPERLEKLREEQAANHQPPRYDKHCRGIDVVTSTERAKTEPFVIRHAIPTGLTVILHDIIRGEISFQSDDLDDYVLLKSDGFPTYQLANVVDDHLMEISHVLRGEEWIPSSPKNLLLYAAFGWQPPAFAHLPVILGPDGKKKLSKRDGAEPALAYREHGYLPEALINFLAFLGWSPGTEEEFFDLGELEKRFDLGRVQKAPAALNPERLDYVNGWYIRRLPVGELVSKLLPFWETAGFLRSEGGRPVLIESILFPQPNVADYLMVVAYGVQERMKRFDEAEAITWFFFKRPLVNPELLVPKKGEWLGTKQVLEGAIKALQAVVEEYWTVDVLEETLRTYIVHTGLQTGDVLWPIRAALTGEKASPGAFEMLAALGREESLLRLQAVVG